MGRGGRSATGQERTSSAILDAQIVQSLLGHAKRGGVTLEKARETGVGGSQ